MKYKVVIETKSRSLCGTVTAQLEPTYKHVSIPSGAYAVSYTHLTLPTKVLV